MRSKGVRLLIAVAVGIGTACATHKVLHVASDESAPHITWELRSGIQEGDERVVCGSSAPRPCVLQASTDQRPTLATVHVYLHPAKQLTTYVGYLRASFLEGDSQGRRTAINATVPPRGQPVGASVTGRVTQTAGAFELEISVDGTATGSADPVHTGERIAVRVEAGG